MGESPDPTGPHHNTPTPVAGVVLLVAISVLVGSITVVYLLEFGTQSTDIAPISDTAFTYDATAAGVDDFGRKLGPGDGLVTITVTAGETVRADRLFVRGDTLAEPKAWAESENYATASEVSAGARLRVAAAPDDRIALIWRSAGDERSALLGSWDGSDS